MILVLFFLSSPLHQSLSTYSTQGHHHASASASLAAPAPSSFSGGAWSSQLPHSSGGGYMHGGVGEDMSLLAAHHQQHHASGNVYVDRGLLCRSLEEVEDPYSCI